MKSFLKKAGRVALVFFILILIGVAVAFGIAYFLKNRELNNIYAEYNQATQNLNQSDKQNQITIGNLQDSYKELNLKIEDLTKENDDLKKKTAVEGFGTLKGSILPFLAGDSNFGQYQQVCAINLDNSSLTYCVTVSGMDPKFTLVVPAAKYAVSAKIVNKNGEGTVEGYKANFTEYVQCVAKSGVASCDKTKLTKKVQLDIKAGETTENVNPTDWVSSKMTP